MRSVWAACSGARSSHWWLISDALRAGTKRSRKSHFYGNIRETAEQRAEFAPRFVEWVIIISVEGKSTPVGDIARTLSVAHIGHPVSNDVNCSNSSFPSTFVLCVINGAVSQLSFRSIPISLVLPRRERDEVDPKRSRTKPFLEITLHIRTAAD